MWPVDVVKNKYTITTILGNQLPYYDNIFKHLNIANTWVGLLDTAKQNSI